MATFFTKKTPIQDKKWQLIDARGQVLGRLAARVSRVLTGKGKTDYTPHVEGGDGVVVINAKEIVVTGKKATDKTYKSFSGYPGGLKERTFERVMRSDPTFPLRHAVKGMLPKSRLGRRMMSRLLVYAGGEHPHAAQKPKPCSPRTTSGARKNSLRTWSGTRGT